MSAKAALDDRNEALRGVVPNILTVRRKTALNEEQEQQCDRSVLRQVRRLTFEIEGYKFGI